MKWTLEYRLEVMLRLIETMSDMRIPVVFVGAMVLKMAVPCSVLDTERATKDIDCNWCGGTPTMEYLFGVLQKAANASGLGLTVQPTRKFTGEQTACFKFYDSDGDYAFKMDMNICGNPFSCRYLTVNGKSVIGASPLKMLSDKICVLSSNKISRRAKDLFDLYLLSALTGYTLSGVYSINSSLYRSNEDFDFFLNRRPELEHAYSKLEGIRNKPSFEVVYSRVMHFAEPFIRRVERDMVWNGYDWVVR